MRLSGPVVVVGHGSSPTNRGWGSHIDACKTVIRMWNWHWQNVPDYGERYDYGFYEISGTEMARFDKHNCRFPAKGWIGSRLKPYEGELPEPTEIIDPGVWEQEGMSMGGIGTKGRLRLTRGVRAVLWAMERMPAGERLVLVGFDAAREGIGRRMEEGFPAEYIACPAVFPFRDYPEKTRGGPIRRYGNHDYGVEGPLLRAVACRLGVDLVHAQDAW